MKVHKNRKKITETRTTITELHNTRMQEFDDYYKTLPDKRSKLVRLKNRLEKKGKKMDPYDRIKLVEEIENMTSEIAKMETQEDMTTYLLSIQPVLRQKGIKRKKGPSPPKSQKDHNSLDAFLVSETDNRKTRLLNEYLTATGGCPVIQYAEYTEKDFCCKDCGEVSNMIIDAVKSSIICESCGLSRDWQDPNHPQWSNETDVSKTYRYQREQYFIDHLNRFQGKENVTLDNKLIQKILISLHKRRINDKKDINSILIRNILKDLNETEYYDHINSIIRKITGEKAPQLSQDIERKLILMFNRTIEPFEKWKTLIKGRMNFLSYPYVIRKLMRILIVQGHSELKYYVDHFRLLKSVEKVRDQEKVWEKICEDNNWPFHKSV